MNSAFKTYFPVHCCYSKDCGHHCRLECLLETLCHFEDGKLTVLDVKVNVNDDENNRIDLNSLKNQQSTQE